MDTRVNIHKSYRTIAIKEAVLNEFKCKQSPQLSPKRLRTEEEDTDSHLSIFPFKGSNCIL